MAWRGVAWPCCATLPYMKIYIILILDIHVFTLLRIEHSATKTDFGSGYHQRYFQTIYYCYTHELHSCPDSCRINQFHISTHVLDPETSYVPHDVFAQNHLQILRQNQWCNMSETVSQAKQTNRDKPQIFLNKSKGLDHVPLFKLPDA